MYSLGKIKLHIVKQINQALEKKLIKASDLVYPPNLAFGDLSLSLFTPARKLNSESYKLAEKLVSKVKTDKIILSLKAVGPYLNFIIDKKFLVRESLNEIDRLKKDYGKNKSGKEKRVMIEYSNANTHKEYHVGHLRNLCFGDAVNRILMANGYKSIPVSYINDFGIHTAKTLWAYLEFYQGKESEGDKGYFLGQVYARAVKEIKEKPASQNMVKFMMKKIEGRQGVEYKLWQKTRQWSIKQLDQIYKELAIKFDHIFYESEFIDQGRDLVVKLYKKRILTRSQGAIIANLEEYNLGVLIFLRNDGSALYPVADIPLAIKKIKKFKLDKSIYIVDVRQSLYFKQLFKVLELLGYKKEMIHLAYEFVKLPSGMISSRTGNIITYEDLYGQILKRAVRETKMRHDSWNSKKIEEVALIITKAAIKFEMVKVSANQIITFDINKALRFDGYTAAYLQYTYARIRSILRKSKVKSQKSKLQIKAQNLNNEKEYGLILKLAKYPEAVARAGENYDPAEIAKYLFELAQSFNDYYHSVPVLQAEEETRKARLVLIKSVSQVIKNGLDLLGIETVEEM